VIVSRLAHVAFDVPDLEAAIRFYEAVLGLAAIARTDECVYLSGGRTATYEVCLRAGAARLDHLAFSVDSLATAGKQLEYEALDVPDEPGVRRAVATCLPGGQVIELIEESAPVGYRTSPRAPALNHCGVGPVTIEHITLLSDDIQADAEFAVDRLGFRITDSVRPPGEPWGNTHMRLGTQHHDLALLRGTGHDRPELHHVCFAVPSVSELVRLADSLATRGMALDASIGRHEAGNNIFLYFKDPFGQRLEVNTDMARVDPAAPPNVIDAPVPFDAWRAGRPPALSAGSATRDGRRTSRLAA
jgi:catechol 2,3-dioxygenase